MANGLRTPNIIDPNDDTRFVAVDPYVIEGVAKTLWHTADDTSLESSGAVYNTNVSSITNNATGEFDVNLTNSYTADNYHSIAQAFAGSRGNDRTAAAASGGPGGQNKVKVAQFENGSLNSSMNSYGVCFGPLA